MEILIQRLILMEVFAASLGTPKGSADNLKKLAQEVDAKINCYREYPQCKSRETEG